MIGCVMFWMLSSRSLVSSDLADTPIPEVGDTEQDRIKEKAPLVWERFLGVVLKLRSTSGRTLPCD